MTEFCGHIYYSSTDDICGRPSPCPLHGLETASTAIDFMWPTLLEAAKRIEALEKAANLLLEAAIVQSDGAFIAPNAFAPAVRAAWLAMGGQS